MDFKIPCLFPFSRNMFVSFEIKVRITKIMPLWPIVQLFVVSATSSLSINPDVSHVCQVVCL